MCKFAWALVAILFVLSAAMSYIFIIKGETIAASDGRTAIILPEGERDIVLSEMRMLLEAVQGILSAVDKDDMEAVSQQAKKVGFAAQHDVPASLRKKLPIAFKKMGMATHKAFDQLALDATDLGDKNQVIQQLGTLMQNCVACHAAYRIEVK